MEPEYVGIDLHRRRSVIVRMSPDGERLSTEKIDNNPMALAAAIAPAGPNPKVVVEATYGWYWAADVLAECGAELHLAHPLGMKGISSNRRVKNDVKDAVLLADLLRLGSLPEAWIAPPGLRELRELVRYRTKLVQIRSGLKAQVHAVMAKEGVLPGGTDMFGPGGQAQLDEMQLGDCYRLRIDSLRDLIDAFDEEVDALEDLIRDVLKDHAGYRAVQAIDGVGPIFAAIFVAEIGDVTRFDGPQKLCSWAGLTPATASPTPPCTGGRSPSRGPGWCGGRPSRPSPTAGAGPSCGPTSTGSPSGGHRQSSDRRRPQAPHARLLRPARRRDPLPGRGELTSSAQPVARSSIGMSSPSEPSKCLSPTSCGRIASCRPTGAAEE